MRLTYDPRYNVAYIRLHEKKTEVQTLRISDELCVDMASDGTIYGIELLNANSLLRAEDQGNPVVINEAIGDRKQIPLSA